MSQQPPLSNASLRLWVTSITRGTVFLALLTFAGLFLLWQWSSLEIEKRLLADSRSQVAGEVDLLGASLTQAVSSRLALVSGLRAFVEANVDFSGSIPEGKFTSFASGLQSTAGGIRDIALAPGGVMEFVYPWDENASVLGYEPAKDPRPYVREEVRRALETGEIILSRPYELIQGGQGLIARQAVYHEGEYWGLANIVIDVPPILEDAGISDQSNGLKLALKDQAGTVFFGEAAIFDKNPATYTIVLPEGTWQLAGVPTVGWKSTYQIPLTYFRWMGMAIVIFLTMTVFLFANRQQRLETLVERQTRELSDANVLLEQELVSRKKTELALRQSEARYRNLIETSPAGILVHTNRVVVFANRAATRLFGAESPEDLIGKPIMNFVHPEFEKTVDERVAQALQSSDEMCPLEEKLIRMDGNEFQAEVRGIGLMYEGKPSVMVFINDVSARLRAEKALQAYSERLEYMVAQRTQQLKTTQEQLVRKEKLAVLGQLAGSVGHELRNPLAVISNAIYFLKSTPEIEASTYREYLDIIANEVHDAEHIVSDLLDFSRSKIAHRQKCLLDDLVQKVLVKHPPPENVQVTIQFPDGNLEYTLDPHQIRQVLTNLFTNAYQAMPDGGRLTIRCERYPATIPDAAPDAEELSTAAGVLIRITDTGTGIPPENLPRLFEPLFTTKPRGVGLGLAVTKNLVSLNGGGIEVESEPGKGTTFIIRFPARDSLDEE